MKLRCICCGHEREFSDAEDALKEGQYGFADSIHGDVAVLTEEESERRKMTASIQTQDYWARCSFYEPFVMGGNVWQNKRYRVEGVPCRKLGQYEVFGYFRVSKNLWVVHEKSTGGLLAEGATLDDAWATAKKNVEDTPDFGQQVAQLGPVERLQEVPTEEAVRRLDKSRG